MQYIPSWLWPTIIRGGEWMLVQLLRVLEVQYPGIKVVVDKVMDILGDVNPPSGAVVARSLHDNFVK